MRDEMRTFGYPGLRWRLAHSGELSCTNGQTP